MIGETYHTRFYHSEGRNPRENTLSLFISPRSFQFAVFDERKKVLVELGHVDMPAGGGSFSDGAHIELLLSNYRLSGALFERAFISVLHPDFLLMPVAFAEENTHKRALEFMGSAEGPASGGRHRLGDIEFCYGTVLPVQQLLERSFSNALIRHAGAVDISLFTAHQDLAACNVFLNIHNGTIALAARKGKKLLFYNVFSVETNEDILYYLLFMAEQFGLPAREIRIGIGGMAEEVLLSLVRKFTGEVHAAGGATPFPLTGKFSGLSRHHYFTLLNQHLCEL